MARRLCLTEQVYAVMEMRYRHRVLTAAAVRAAVERMHKQRREIQEAVAQQPAAEKVA